MSLTRAMALELAPYRIRVNAIAPGLTDTAQPRYGSSEAEIAEMARSIAVFCSSSCEMMLATSFKKSPLVAGSKFRLDPVD